MARLLHPDLNPDEATRLAGSPDIRLVNEAWEVLGDPALREAYDRACRPGEAQAAVHEDHDLHRVGLPQVPQGFELHPHSGGASSWFHCRFADARKVALSLAAQSADLSSLSQLDDGQLWLLDLMRVPVKDSDLRSLSRFQRLEVLLLDGSGVTDAGLDWLRRFPLLHTVSLTNCRITDDGMPALAKIPALENLEVDQTLITDAGLAAFEGHPTLMVLDIRRTKVRGDGLRYLVGLPKLRELRVSGWADLAANKAFRGRRDVNIL